MAQHSRDFTFVANAVEANFLASKAEGESVARFSISPTGHRVTIQELAEKNRRILRLARAASSMAHRREGDILHSYADISKAEKRLGYKPVVGFDDGFEGDSGLVPGVGVLKMEFRHRRP